MSMPEFAMKSPCAFEGCPRLARGKRLCPGHNAQKRRGEELRPLRRRVDGDVSARLEAYIDRSGECWLWMGPRNAMGYGTVSISGVRRLAHRVTYEKEYGPIEEQLVIDHSCFTPACVRPSHLEAVSRRENDENRKGAQSNSKSGIRGVSWDERRGKWYAHVGSRGKRIFVGYFESAVEAERAAVKRRNELHTNNRLDRRGVSA